MKPHALKCSEYYHKQAEIRIGETKNVESGEVRQPSISMLLACRRITRRVAYPRRPRAAKDQSRGLEQPISKHVNVAWIVQAIAIKQRESERPRPHNVLKHFWPRVEKRPASSSPR